MPFFDRWAVTHAGLFTFPQSPKHLSLYQSYGFMPRFLTPVLAKPLAASTTADDAGRWGTAGDAADPGTVVAGCARVTDATYPGLDVTREIQAVAAQKLGDTVVVHDDAGGVDATAHRRHLATTYVAKCRTSPRRTAQSFGSSQTTARGGSVRDKDWSWPCQP
jgi:hypothetical protein